MSITHVYVSNLQFNLIISQNLGFVLLWNNLRTFFRSNTERLPPASSLMYYFEYDCKFPVSSFQRWFLRFKH